MKKGYQLLKRAWLPMVLIAGLAACSTAPDGGTGTMEVRMHDAPGDYDEVNVFIERVEVNREESEEGWQVIAEPNRVFDLLELVNGAYEVLGEEELESGTYRQIRLIVRQEGTHVIENGEEVELTVPSGEQTGLKLNVNAVIEPDTRYVLVLDFDADRSIVKRGNSGMGYLLKPVIRANSLATTGTISGTATPEARAAAYAILNAGTAEADTVSGTFADETDGQFKLSSLPEDTYTVSIVPREEGFEEHHEEDVEVTAGEDTNIGEIDLTLETTE
ncbi:MAG: DUF4382 domain-containing protein [Balneolaceae bacterium]